MKKRSTHSIYTVSAVVFSLICVVYIARLINLQFNIAKTRDLRESSEITVETETVQALRGNICDRNGNILVSSAFSYDIILDYSSMPDSKADFNQSVLALLRAVEETGSSEKRPSDLYPFEGTYPELSYSEEAKTEGSSVKNALDNVLKRQELEGADAKTLTARIVKKYGLSAKDKNGDPLYSDSEINELIRIYYDLLRIQFSSVQPYTVLSGVGIDTVTYVKELSIQGVSDKICTKRTYCYPGYASHILGRVGAITAETWETYKEKGYNMNDTVGIDGCEYIFEDYLRGTDGVRTTKRNAKGEIIEQYISVEPIAGKDVYLTIDIDTQIAAEDALAKYMEESGKEKGASVAIDQNNGDILAIASYPTFDLTTFSEDYASLSANENSPLLNRAIYATYAPGSTYKIAVALAGLEEGCINRYSENSCYGGYQSHGMHINCENHTGIYNLDLIDAITHSCNAYFINLGYDKLGSIDKMTEYCKLLGLGQSTGIELDEKTGQIACPENATEWTAYEEASSYIGQSVHKYTPLQLSCYIATVANGGTRYSAHLLHSVRTFSGDIIYEYEPEVLSTVSISSSTLSAIKDGMKSMVDNSGSASYYMYYVQDIQSTVYGKSGTAQIGNDKQNCWFTAFTQDGDKGITVTSIIEEGSTGASVSEIDAAVIGAYLNGSKQ